MEGKESSLSMHPGEPAGREKEGFGSYLPWCGRMSVLSECTYIRNPEVLFPTLVLEASSCSALHLPSHVLAPCRHTVCVWRGDKV